MSTDFILFSGELFIAAGLWRISSALFLIGKILAKGSGK